MNSSITLDRTKVIYEMAQKNLNVEKLSCKAGVGRQAIWKMRHNHPVRRSIAERVAAALAVTLEDLQSDGKSDCEFCKSLHWWKNHELNGEGLYTTYKVSLITETRRKGGGFCGNVTHEAGPLNFCPECGRTLKK